MNRTLLALTLAAPLYGQIQPKQPLEVTRVNNITTAYNFECGGVTDCLDNRSVYQRNNNYHAVYATGPGTWQVQIQYANGSPSGFTSCGSAATITQSSNPAIAYCTGYYDYLLISITGSNAATVSVNYTGQNQLYLSPSTGSVSFPCTVSQGCTGATSFNTDGVIYMGSSTFGSTTVGNQYNVLQSNGSGSPPSFGPVNLASPNAVTGVLLPANGGSGASVIIPASPYNFAAQTPGGSLSIGSNSITLTPCPAGVNGTDANHSLYISGGTGTAEAVPITGGTCTSGASSGTVIITAANTHSGAWTIQSVFGGVPEAMIANAPSANIGITTPITAYGKLTVASGNYTLLGTSPATSQITRSSGFNNDNLIWVTSSGSVAFQNLGINANNSSGAYASIYCGGSPSGGGVIYLQNVLVNSGYNGVVSDTCGSTIVHNYYYENGNAGGALANSGIKLDCNYGAENNVVISDSYIVNFGSPLGVDGIDDVCGDGVTISNVGISGQRGFIFEPSSSKYIANTTLSNLAIDSSSSTTFGYVFAATGTPANYSDITITGGWVNGEAVSGMVGMDVCFTYGPCSISNLTVSGVNFISAGYTSNAAVLIGKVDTGGPITFTGDNINGNGSSSSVGVIVSDTSGTISKLSFVGNNVSNYPTGVEILTGVSNAAFASNNLSTNTTPLVISSTFSGILGPNAGVDNVTTTTLASASAVTLGVQSYYQITGTTQVNTINGGWAGRQVKLQFTNASPGGLGATGNVYYAKTLTQNQGVTCTFDGTKWLCIGP